MERARAGCGAFAVAAARRQAHQCRFSQCRFNSARQHHDARTGHDAPTNAASAGFTGECAAALAAPGVDRGSRTRGGQKAVRAETRARTTDAAFAGAGVGSGGLERLMLSKAFADC